VSDIAKRLFSHSSVARESSTIAYLVLESILSGRVLLRRALVGSSACLLGSCVSLLGFVCLPSLVPPRVLLSVRVFLPAALQFLGSMLVGRCCP